MALNWLKWVKGFSRRREVLAIGKALNLDRRVVACACFEFWEWSDENTTTGSIPGVTPEFIDEHVGIRGFAVALKIEGWLKINDDGIIIPRFKRHNGDSSKNRAKDAERQARKREKDVRKKSHVKRDEVRTREDKIREDKNTDVRSSENSLEGMQGEPNSHWEFQIDFLADVTTRHLEDDSAICFIHRKCSEEKPDAVCADENGLRRVFGSSVVAIRGKKNKLNLFKYLICNPSRAVIVREDQEKADLRLKRHRQKIENSTQKVDTRWIPVCDEVPA